MADVASLRDAIEAGDLASVDAAIRAGVDANVVVDPYDSLLHSAIEQMQVEVARRLIAAGADLEQESIPGWTPLVHAIDIESDAAWQAGLPSVEVSTELTELLLTSGAIPTDRAIEVARRYENHRALDLMSRAEPT